MYFMIVDKKYELSAQTWTEFSSVEYCSTKLTLKLGGGGTIQILYLIGSAIFMKCR